MIFLVFVAVVNIRIYTMTKKYQNDSVPSTTTAPISTQVSEQSFDCSTKIAANENEKKNRILFRMWIIGGEMHKHTQPTMSYFRMHLRSKLKCIEGGKRPLNFVRVCFFSYRILFPWYHSRDNLGVCVSFALCADTRSSFFFYYLFNAHTELHPSW